MTYYSSPCQTGYYWLEKVYWNTFLAQASAILYKIFAPDTVQSILGGLHLDRCVKITYGPPKLEANNNINLSNNQRLPTAN